MAMQLGRNIVRRHFPGSAAFVARDGIPRVPFGVRSFWKTPLTLDDLDDFLPKTRGGWMCLHAAFALSIVSEAHKRSERKKASDRTEETIEKIRNDLADLDRDDSDKA